MILAKKLHFLKFWLHLIRPKIDWLFFNTELEKEDNGGIRTYFYGLSFAYSLEELQVECKHKKNYCERNGASLLSTDICLHNSL